jgi:hypothetical protein
LGESYIGIRALADLFLCALKYPTLMHLPTNFIDDPKALLKRTKAKLKRVSALELEDNHIR